MNKENLILAELYKDGYTSIPNYYFDSILPTLTVFEDRILQVIFRKTLGFRKLEDKISLSQIVKLSGLAKSTCINCLKTLEEKNFIFIKRITCEKTKQTNVIKINIKKLFAGSTPNGLGLYGSSNFYSPSDGHTKETKQNKREFFSFEKKEEYPEIPIFNNEMLQNARDFNFNEVNTLS